MLLVREDLVEFHVEKISRGRRNRLIDGIVLQAAVGLRQESKSLGDHGTGVEVGIVLKDISRNGGVSGWIIQLHTIGEESGKVSTAEGVRRKAGNGAAAISEAESF